MLVRAVLPSHQVLFPVFSISAYVPEELSRSRTFLTNVSLARRCDNNIPFLPTFGVNPTLEPFRVESGWGLSFTSEGEAHAPALRWEFIGREITEWFLIRNVPERRIDSM